MWSEAISKNTPSPLWGEGWGEGRKIELSALALTLSPETGEREF